MDNRDFEAWMGRQGMSPNLAAGFLDLDRKTVDRYLAGDLEIPQRVEIACSTLDPLCLYQLVPIDIKHNDWRASRYQGLVIVRAHSVLLARWHAAAAFHFSARRRSDDEATPENPWLQAERVSVCAIEERPGLRLAGQPGVVQPDLAILEAAAGKRQ